MHALDFKLIVKIIEQTSSDFVERISFEKKQHHNNFYRYSLYSYPDNVLFFKVNIIFGNWKGICRFLVLYVIKKNILATHSFLGEPRRVNPDFS